MVLAVFIICVLHCVLQKRVINHMALNKLSDKKLRSLLGRRSERQETIADGNGLSVRVSKYGCVSFVFFYLFSFSVFLPLNILFLSRLLKISFALLVTILGTPANLAT